MWKKHTVICASRGQNRPKICKIIKRLQWIIRGSILRFILTAFPPFVWVVHFIVWLYADEFSPYMGRRTSSTLSLTNGSASPRQEPSGSQSVPQRKRLLKAPSLAELDSSDSDVSMSFCVWHGAQKCLFGAFITNNDWSACILNSGWDCWTQIGK